MTFIVFASGAHNLLFYKCCSSMHIYLNTHLYSCLFVLPLEYKIRNIGSDLLVGPKVLNQF